MKLVCYVNLDYSKKSFALFDKFEDACLAAYVAYRNNPNMAFFTGHYVVRVLDLDRFNIDFDLGKDVDQVFSDVKTDVIVETHQVKDMLTLGKKLASEEKFDI